MKRKLGNSLKAAIKLSVSNLDENHLQKVIAGAHDEFYKKEKRNRINFTAFLVRQIKYTAWKIWIAQGMILIVLCMVLSACFGDLFLSRPQHVAVLLGGSAILVLMTAIPFIQRGLRYKMHETEAATKFSSANLLAAKLLIIGTGDSIMLGSILLLALVKTTLNIGTVALYLMLPFLTVTSIFLYILGHVPAHLFSVYSGGIGAAVFLVITGLCYLYPEIATQVLPASWGLICIVPILFCIYQLRYIMRRSSYATTQFA